MSDESGVKARRLQMLACTAMTRTQSTTLAKPPTVLAIRTTSTRAAAEAAIIVRSTLPAKQPISVIATGKEQRCFFKPLRGNKESIEAD
jgi:hypothetical protein